MKIQETVKTETFTQTNMSGEYFEITMNPGEGITIWEMEDSPKNVLPIYYDFIHVTTKEELQELRELLKRAEKFFEEGK